MTEKPLYLEPKQVGVDPPTDYENILADALEAAFADGIHDLDALVARLNGLGVRPPGGADWTPDSFRAEVKRLAPAS